LVDEPADVDINNLLRSEQDMDQSLISKPNAEKPLSEKKSVKKNVKL
jgi:hypothetical protein